MVSARPQFEAACQLQKSCWSSTVAVQRACTSPTSVRFTRPAPDVLWRDWPNGLGTGLWLRSREFDSLISPQIIRGLRGKPLRPRQLLALIRRLRWLTRLGGSYKGITHGLHP